MENEGIALSREKILNHVWNYDYFGDARTIDTHVKKLRAKIGEKRRLHQKPSGAWVTNLKQKKMAVISNDEKQEKRI